MDRSSMVRIKLLVPILGVIATCLFFAAAELALRVAGFRFSPWYLKESLFVAEHDGIHVHTDRMFLDPEPYGFSFCVKQRFTVVKAAETLRIAIVGESSVQRLGDAGELAGVLRKKFSRPVEVLNFGFSGCGIERVLLSVQEALRFGPDVIFIYVGHNEFVSYSNPATMLDSHGQPKTHQPERPPLRIAQLISKEYLSIWPATLETFRGQIRRYTAADKEMFYDEFRRNLEAMVAAGRAHGVPVVLSTVAYNYGYGLAYAPDYPNFLEARQWDTPRLAEELRRDPGNATLEMVLGYRRLRSGQLREARRLLDQAFVDEERPIRATVQINEIIRSVALKNGTPLVDVHAVVDAAARDGLPAFDLFVDNCHLNETGKNILMTAAAATLEKVLKPR